MPSSFAWLDYDEASRQRMRELVGLFQEPGSIDELGLGRIRDAFSDRFFPGTSVLWRRARYLFFVPWVYAEIEAHGFQRQPNAELAARALQRKLRDALASTRDTDGVIGLRQADPNSPPDVILWAALEQWGLREPGGGSLAQYQSTLQRRPPARARRDEPAERYTSWTDRLMPAPDAFPDAASFKLRGPEARLLRDLTLEEDAEDDSPGARRRESMMASLLRSGAVTDAPSPWLHPLDARAGDKLRLALHMSGCFSDVMHGARLAYALRLAQLRKQTDHASDLDQHIAAWAHKIMTDRPEELRAWVADMPGFWRVVRGLNDRISLGEQTFVESWSALALRDPTRAAVSTDAVRLIEAREAVKKGSRARLTTPREKDRGEGGAIPAPMTYRWNNGWQIAADILEGLAQ